MVCGTNLQDISTDGYLNFNVRINFVFRYANVRVKIKYSY